VYGAVDLKEVAELQRIIDEGFSRREGLPISS
jgi:hypothetical protein